jgi:hypothetical protein
LLMRVTVVTRKLVLMLVTMAAMVTKVTSASIEMLETLVARDHDNISN